MITLFTAIKGMFWGFCLLFLLVIAFLSGANVTDRIGSLLPSNTHVKVNRVAQVVNPKLDKLETFYRKDEYKNQQAVIDEIRRDIRELCDDCKIASFYPSSAWDVSTFRNYLETRLSPEATSQNNQTYTISAVAAGLCFLISAYALIALFMLRANPQKLVTLIILLTPVVFIVLGISGYQMDSKYFYPQYGYDGKGLNNIFLSILAIFIVYPSVYAVLNKKQISLKEIFLLKS